MYPGLLFLPLYYALILAALAFVPGLVAIALALATRKAAGSYDDQRPAALGRLWAASHGLSRRLGVVLLAVSCGFVGAGLFSVCLNMALLAFVLISFSLSPAAGADDNMTLIGFGYVGVLVLGFLLFFAMGMDRLVRWLGPKDA